MYAIHAICLPHPEPGMARVFFGKGKRDEEAVRTRLTPEHADATILFSAEILTKPELDMRLLSLLDGLIKDGFMQPGSWTTMRKVEVPLHLAASTRTMLPQADFVSAASGLIIFREHLGVDQGVIAAMMGTNTTRVHRLEQGKSKFTFEDFRRLNYWAGRLRARPVFMAAFPISPENPEMMQ